MHRALVVAVLAFAVVATTLGSADAAKSRMKLTSPAFAAGEMIPDGFTCDGVSASPPLRWKGVPKGTVELAITVEDPDTARGTFTHWVAWGIDPTLGALPEETLPDEVVQGSPSYIGPCPPSGQQHRYRFTLYAVDEPIALEAGTATIDDLRAAIKGTVTAKAKLVGVYERDSAVA